MKRERMTSEHFDKIVCYMKTNYRVTLSDINIQYAKQVLVDGRLAKRVGDSVGVSRQRISRAVKKIRIANNEMKGLPESFITLTITVPATAIGKIEAIEKELQSGAVDV